MKIVLGELNGERLFNIARQAVPFCTEVEAAVAYTGNADHPLLQSCKDGNLKLTFYGLLDEGGAVKPTLLQELLSWGPARADVRLVKGNFHPKVIWWRGYGAYVGSANLSHQAWYNNIEAGVFFDEAELTSSPAGADLDGLFDHLAAHSIAVTNEVVKKLRDLAAARQPLRTQEELARKRFADLFGNFPDNPGLTTAPLKGRDRNAALKRFTLEWTETLQKMRDLARDFERLQLRPAWVDQDAHPAIHFDQFLHAYYYEYIRKGIGLETDDERSSVDQVEASFARNQARPARALRDAGQWWAALPTDPRGEQEAIRTRAPGMRQRFSREALPSMDLASFTLAMRNVTALRVHARQIKNSDLDLPAGHRESEEERVVRLCEWLWSKRTKTGRTVRDVLEFVLWGEFPRDMEHRLWLGIWGDEYALPHLGRSILGEAVGWARPDDFPPRNDRTNKALRALGHDVKLF